MIMIKNRTFLSDGENGLELPRNSGRFAAFSFGDTVDEKSLDEARKRMASQQALDEGRARNDRKEKPTKYMNVPAAPFLRIIALDEDMEYPIEIVLRERKTEASWTMANAEQLAGLCAFNSINGSRVLHAGRTAAGRMYVECGTYGGLEMTKRWLPDLPEKSVLGTEETVELFKLFKDAGWKIDISQQPPKQDQPQLEEQLVALTALI